MNRLGQQEARQSQMISSPPEEDSALVAAVLRKDRKATAEFVALYADDDFLNYVFVIAGRRHPRNRHE